ncbi:MBOAT family O-acyltransferase [Paenibacillus sp. GCM10027626]|uniref:MBOAT family O-acyltransferase n=1 Tax=Paenibacillus sp. GCM10027626 TaxID=3273411 RepID=UPI003626C141
MFLTDAGYWLFVLVMLICYYVLPVVLRPWVLVGAGIIFYIVYTPQYALLTIVHILIIYGLVRLAWQRQDKKTFFTAALLLAALALLYFKYSGMIVDSVNSILSLFSRASLPRIETVIIPLGLSYLTFEMIHYIVEMRRGNLPEHRMKHFLSFVLFFPTLVAGPIKQFQHFYPQLANRFESRNLAAGAYRILIGLFKKLVIADTLMLFVEPLHDGASIAQSPISVLWLGLVAYSFVIYLDFSGYSDIAIGTAKLFGITIPENFRWPYLSKNIAEFWNRWHISLGKWLTAYVYFPLGGSRGSQLRTCFNLIVTLGVSGLWHGAGWHFVVWGLCHGVMLAVHRLYAKLLKPKLKIPKRMAPFTNGAAMLLTFSLVVITRVFFILPLVDGMQLLQKLFLF